MIEFDTHQIRTTKPAPHFALLDEMIVERGTKVDWDLLHDLHYKGESLPLGPHFWRLQLHGHTIGVLVTGTPKGLLRERHLVFPKLKPGAGETKFTNTLRYNHINRHFRVISRFVIDTMYRGIGAGYRMMNLVARMEGLTFMEIQSSMSKLNSFGQKAGFQFVTPLNANNFELGLKFFRAHFNATPQDYEAIVTEIESKTSESQTRLIEECKSFYLHNSARENTGAGKAKGAARVAAMDAREVIKAIQQIALSSPMYGVYKCPDAKGTVPEHLPLIAFDWQKPNQVFQPQ